MSGPVRAVLRLFSLPLLFDPRRDLEPLGSADVLDWADIESTATDD